MSQKMFHRSASTLLALVLALAIIHPVLAAPPGNDNFADAIPIALPFSVTADVSEAGTEPNEPYFTCSYSEQTVWYVFTPAESMTVHLTMQANGIPTSVGVYRTTSPDITSLAHEQCAEYYNPVLTIPMEAGYLYYFQVGSSSGATGTAQIDIERIPPPANNNFSDATEISSLPFHDSLDNTGASTEIGEPANCYSPRYTVWYSFTPASDGVIRADMAGSSFFDNQLTLYTDSGSGIGGLNFVRCGYFGTAMTFSVQAGITYYIQAGNIGSNGGDLHINLEEVLPPSNDNFANAMPITSLPFTANLDTAAATFEPNEPVACGYPSPPYKTVWFKFVAPQTTSISASVPSFSFSAFLGVYSGTGLNNLTQLGCGQYSNLVTVRMVQGQTYYFQVGGYYGEGGVGSFLLDFAPAPVVNFNFYPGDPSKYDIIQFCSSSYDPGNVGFDSFTWSFGDGSTATGGCATHRYAADGDYTVQHNVTTLDGRSAASNPQVVQIRTHDVAITKVTAPNSANVGQTRTITVTVRNVAYAETVQVELFVSTPGGFVPVATVTKLVPALSGNRTTTFSFNYTFTSADAKIGKVTFKAVATLLTARDAVPIDNEAVSTPPTKVNR